MEKGALRKIYERDEQCAFWLVSAIAQLAEEHPKMSLKKLRDTIILEELTESVAAYHDYLRET